MPMTAAKEIAKEYDDIPGTFVFDADRSRVGYHLNMFCMSLMKAENRKAFKADEPKYLEERFPPLTPEEREAAGGDPQAPLQPAAGTRRQHLLHGQVRGERRPSVPASRRADDRLDSAG